MQSGGPIVRLSILRQNGAEVRSYGWFWYHQEFASLDYETLKDLESFDDRILTGLVTCGLWACGPFPSEWHGMLRTSYLHRR